jgi:hypothetical protein
MMFAHHFEHLEPFVLKPLSLGGALRSLITKDRGSASSRM